MSQTKREQFQEWLEGLDLAEFETIVPYILDFQYWVTNPEQQLSLSPGEITQQLFDFLEQEGLIEDFDPLQYQEVLDNPDDY